MNAYDIMHEWDRATGREARSDGQFDADVPALLAGTDYEDWKRNLEAKHVASITKGMRAWGLPVDSGRF